MRRFPIAIALSVLILGAATSATAAAETDFFTWLSGSHHYPRAHGNSEYELEGSRREAEVTVTGIRGLAGKRVTVNVNGQKLGRILVSSRGRAHREWSTAHGQSVPRAGTGSPVRVRTAGGTLIVSGRYQRESDSD